MQKVYQSRRRIALLHRYFDHVLTSEAQGWSGRASRLAFSSKELSGASSKGVYLDQAQRGFCGLRFQALKANDPHDKNTTEFRKYMADTKMRNRASDPLIDFCGWKGVVSFAKIYTTPCRIYVKKLCQIFFVTSWDHMQLCTTYILICYYYIFLNSWYWIFWHIFGFCYYYNILQHTVTVDTTTAAAQLTRSMVLQCSAAIAAISQLTGFNSTRLPVAIIQLLRSNFPALALCRLCATNTHGEPRSSAAVTSRCFRSTGMPNSSCERKWSWTSEYDTWFWQSQPFETWTAWKHTLISSLNPHFSSFSWCTHWDLPQLGWLSRPL